MKTNWFIAGAWACLAVSFVSLMLVIALFMLPFDVFGA